MASLKGGANRKTEATHCWENKDVGKVENPFERENMPGEKEGNHSKETPENLRKSNSEELGTRAPQLIPVTTAPKT